MSRVQKILFNTKQFPYKTIKKNKNIKNIPSSNLSKTKIFNGALALGILGLAFFQSCNIEKEPLVIQTSTENKFSNVLTKDFDLVLNHLGFIVPPQKTLKEVETISFQSNLAESFHLKPLSISEEGITLKQIKYREDLSREDSIIKVSSADNGLILTKISDGTISENKLMFNHDKIIVFDKVDEIWVENSTLEKFDDNYVLQTFVDGNNKLYKNIKNNTDFPENIYFETPEEHEDEIVFG
jgi:hypothetical protein